MDMLGSAKSATAPHPRQLDASSLVKIEDFKTPDRAASSADRSSVLSTSPLNHPPTKIRPAPRLKESPPGEPRHKTAEDTKTPRKRKSDLDLSADVSSPKTARLASNTGRSAEDSLPKTPRSSRVSRISLRSLDSAPETYRTLADIDLDVALERYPQSMRDGLRAVFHYRLNGDLRRWYGMAMREALNVHRRDRRAFSMAQTLCRMPDRLLPPTVVFGRRFADPGVHAVLPYIPRMDPSESDTASERTSNDSNPTLDWNRSLESVSPYFLPRRERSRSPHTHSSDASGGLVSNLNSSVLSRLRLRDSEIGHLRGHSFYGATTNTSASSDIASYNPFAANNRSGDSPNSNQSFLDFVHRDMDNRERQSFVEDSPPRTPATSPSWNPFADNSNNASNARDSFLAFVHQEMENRERQNSIGNTPPMPQANRPPPSVRPSAPNGIPLDTYRSTESTLTNPSFYELIDEDLAQRQSPIADTPPWTTASHTPSVNSGATLSMASVSGFSRHVDISLASSSLSESPRASRAATSRSSRSPSRSASPLATARSARSPTPLATARSPSPPPTPSLASIEQRIGTALKHLVTVGTVPKDALDMVLALTRGRSSTRTLLKKELQGEDVTAKHEALWARVRPVINDVNALK